ncbi:hypothetical protein F511_08813 [Dorcoceras hygrometricum]|uniref:Uncharacterized protein n=1 Tax=Dorcoceras hygrometricum TaxID=472368 RepID=A0A2Z7BX76_9LAMI|nr:hypothetical protein F511_08813 [Dorcoceras hygrometricum]
MERSAKDDATSCWSISRWISDDNVIGDVIIFSRWLEQPVARFSRLAIAKRCRLHKLIRQRFALAMKIQQEDFALIISADEATGESVAAQRYPDAIDEPDASNNIAFQSRAYMNQLLLLNQVASFAYSVDLVPRRKELKKEQSAAVVGMNQQRSS